MVIIIVKQHSGLMMEAIDPWNAGDHPGDCTTS